jgi:hypothetical protein
MNLAKAISTLGLVSACAVAVTASASRPESGPPCPPPDPAARGAAEGAVALMRALGPELGKDVLSPSLYRLAPSGRGIEFSPRARGITDSARARLTFAQLDESVADYLRAGQSLCEMDSRGFYLRLSSQALAVAAAPGQPWCGATLKRSSVVTVSGQQNPFVSRAEPVDGQFRSAASMTECSPFLGSKQSNAFLLAELSDLPQGDRVLHTLAMDPVPYAEPGAYYNPPGSLCGIETNPFIIVGSLYATSDHAYEYAERVVNGVCEIGTFSDPVAILGTTEYKYVKIDGMSCTVVPADSMCGSP